VTALAAPAITSRCLPAVNGGVDRAIRVSTAAVVLAVAGVAAYISYWHAYAVVREYGESGVTAVLEPATIDGLVYASSMVILYAARHRLTVPRLARWMLALCIAASLAVNVAQGWSHGLVGAVVAAWPAVALVGSYELLAWMVRTAAARGPDHVPEADQRVPQADQPDASLRCWRHTESRAALRRQRALSRCVRFRHREAARRSRSGSARTGSDRQTPAWSARSCSSGSARSPDPPAS
jgi:hypothetical protein